LRLQQKQSIQPVVPVQADVDRLEAAVAAAKEQVTRHDQELAALEERRRAVQVHAAHRCTL